MKKNLIGFAVASAFAFAASTASAAEVAYDGAWYALPGVNVMHADSDLEAEPRSVGGFLKFGKEISEHWDVQIGLSHNSADSDLQGVSGKYRQTLFGVDALYFFSRDKFRPFLLAGVGAGRNNVDYTSDVTGADLGDKKTSWMANVGFGAQYLFNENFGLQADLRQVWSRAEYAGSSGIIDTHTISNTYLNLGAIFRFGAPKPAPVVEPTPEPVAVAPEPEPVVEPAPAPVGPAEPAFEKVTLSSEVLFGFDKDNLKEEGKAKLNADVVEKMKAHPEVELVLITGHTDRIGDETYNQKLSERRANTVKQYLISQGIEESRLHAVGKGESEPVVECAGVRGKKAIECLQPNRRVVVEIEVQRASE
ncbi:MULTISPECIES: OmpA family protein [Methylobacillus]|uniref:OmpA/MotB n=1 Tax=Methylobacillus flagellatus (strain ATCC 51484 / DSM 6875 / VKM B-1610 / KT) TaxID=265072 RepID=Q1H0Z1_METFK|nr:MULTISPECIES: OmpA family protein [Methylobacillus]ABE49846.1 OmpA/MotB [Methylobacillus flagellatus KT]MPS48928.1 flagellar motor protein MotB [Methylobacillus sp.]